MYYKALACILPTSVLLLLYFSCSSSLYEESTGGGQALANGYSRWAPGHTTSRLAATGRTKGVITKYESPTKQAINELTARVTTMDERANDLKVKLMPILEAQEPPPNVDPQQQ